jgi:hypothetical protein
MIQACPTVQDILDNFQKAEFWYADAGTRSFGSVTSSSSAMSSSFRKSVHRNEEKWWLPVPCVPDTGLTEKACKDLRKKRDCANQIHKAAVAINSGVLSDMEVPESFMAVLPKVQSHPNGTVHKSPSLCFMLKSSWFAEWEGERGGLGVPRHAGRRQVLAGLPARHAGHLVGA